MPRHLMLLPHCMLPKCEHPSFIRQRAGSTIAEHCVGPVWASSVGKNICCRSDCCGRIGQMLTGVVCSLGAHLLWLLQGVSAMHTPSGLRDMSLLRLAGSNLAGGSSSARSSMSAEPQRAAGGDAGVAAAAAASDSGSRCLPGSPATLQALRERMTSR
jgi:hypothetical protein